MRHLLFVLILWGTPVFAQPSALEKELAEFEKEMNQMEQTLKNKNEAPETPNDTIEQGRIEAGTVNEIDQQNIQDKEKAIAIILDRPENEKEEISLIDLSSEKLVEPLKEPNVSGPDFDISPLKVIPPFEGAVLADKGYQDLLTTVQSWIPESPGKCEQPIPATKLCQKSLALKELLNRFSGTDAFYESLCEDFCEEGTPLLTSLFLEVNKIQPSLRVIWNGRQCSLRLTKEEAKWHGLTLQGAGCRCVQGSCEK